MKFAASLLKWCAIPCCMAAATHARPTHTPVFVHVQVTSSDSDTIARLYTTGDARFAIGSGMPIVHKDTVQFVPPVRLIADVSGGEIHFDAERGGLAVMVKPADSSAAGVAAAGQHIVLRQGSTQILAYDNRR